MAGSTDLSFKPSLSITEAFEVPDKLLNLYFIEGSYFYESKVGLKEKKFTHIKREIIPEKIFSHFNGEISIAAPSAWNGLCKSR